MNGFEMYGKALKVSRAKSHSDETVKRKATDMFDEHKRKRLMLKGMLPLPQPCKAHIDHVQISSAQKKTQKRKPTLQSPPRNLVQQRRELPLSQTNTCGQTRHSFSRTSLAMSTRTTSRRFSNASKASRKCALCRLGPWPLRNSKTNNLQSPQKRLRPTHRLARTASQ
jgi:hypothetical protein